MDKNKIANVDYHDYSQGDAATRSQFIQEFGDSFSNMGFAIVKNHGVTPELRARLFEVSKKWKGSSKSELHIYQEINTITDRTARRDINELVEVHELLIKHGTTKGAYYTFVGVEGNEDSKA